MNLLVRSKSDLLRAEVVQDRLQIAVLEKLGSRRSLWDHMRSHFRHFEFATMHQLYEVVLYDLARELPAPQLHGCYGSRVT